jgi:hypothetical protein
MSLIGDYLSEQRRTATADVQRQIDTRADAAEQQVQTIGDRLIGVGLVGVGLLAVYLGRQALSGK